MNGRSIKTVNLLWSEVAEVVLVDVSPIVQLQQPECIKWEWDTILPPPCIPIFSSYILPKVHLSQINVDTVC